MAQTVTPEQQTRQQTPESGIRYDRVMFIREEIGGVTPEDPDWMRFSDLVMELDADPDPGNEPVHTLGSPDPAYFGKGLEENEFTITYALQRSIMTTDGELQDACADALLRNEAGQCPNTHSILTRQSNPTRGPDDAEDVYGQRQYIVGKGGKADVSIEPDAEDEEPVPVEMTYMPELLRTYHIWQPMEATSLTVVSTHEADEGIEVTIESENAELSETLELAGETPVATETEFGDIDAFRLSEDTYGDVTLSINDGTPEDPEPGTQLSILHGSSYYSADGGALEGDSGVPALGNGSFEPEIGEPYEDIQDDIFEFEFADPTAPTPDLFNITLEIENNLEFSPQQGTTRPRVHEGNREITIETSVVGERATHDMLHQAYSKRPVDLGWELRHTRFTFPDAVCTEPPSPAAESEQSFVEIEGTYMSRGVIIEAIDGDVPDGEDSVDDDVGDDV